MRAEITQYPETFDQVARIKREVTHQPILPGDEELWILGTPMMILIDGVERIEVAKGFTTDGASVPKIGQVLTGWSKWDEPGRYPAIAHDWLYCVSGVRKSKADWVFRSLLGSEGASWWQCNVMYWAVAVGGWWAYKADQDSGPSIYV